MSSGYAREGGKSFANSEGVLTKNRVYTFGPFRISSEERLLRRGSEVIPLPPKAVDTLLILVSSGGRVVEKDDLLQRIWPDTFVEEGGLARNISLLRKTLGEEPDYIETIPRRGYRFVAQVEIGGDDAPLTLAVLPMANLSGDPSQEYFADGMTEELISHFMSIDRLRVCSRTSVSRVKGSHAPLKAIAQELGARWVVEGSVLQAHGRVRITARLIEAASETHVWAQTYERDLRDVISLQNEVAAGIAREIRLKLTLPESRVVDPAAYQDYLRGRYFLNKRTPEDLKRSRDYFRKAIDEDPTYAPAHCGLADAYALMASSGYDVMAPREAMPLARSAAKNALDLDGKLADAHAALGYVALVYDWDWSAAERHLQRAIALNPAYAPAHQWLGELWLARANPAEAIAAFRRALDLDPLSVPCNLGLGWSYYFSQNYDQAIQQYQKTLEIAPGVPMALYGLGLTYHHTNRRAEGLGEIQKAFAASGGDAAAIMLVGVTHALTGDRSGAETQLKKLAELGGQKYVPAVYFAFVCSALNDVDGAFRWLEKACEERSSYLIFLKVQPSMENLRSDARYGALLRRIGLGV